MFLSESLAKADGSKEISIVPRSPSRSWVTHAVTEDNRIANFDSNDNGLVSIDGSTLIGTISTRLNKPRL